MKNESDRLFFKALGLSDEDIESFLPDWTYAKRKFKISDADLDFSINVWIPKYWDLSLRGIQKGIMAYIRELVEVSKFDKYKADGDIIIYSNMPASPVCIRGNSLAGNGKVHVAHPDFIIMTVLSAFFHKDLEKTSGTKLLDNNCRHCGMNCLRAEASCKGIITEPTVSWIWGLHCDEGPKTEEMIDCLTGGVRNSVFTMLPHDAEGSEMEWQDDKKIKYLAAQIRLGQEKVSKITGIHVEDGHMAAAMDDYMGYMRRLEELTRIVAYADPQPITGNALTLFGACMQLSFETGFGNLNDAIDTIIEEVKDRVSRNEGVLPKGAPKLACHFTPLNVPWVDKAFRENGVCLSISTIFAPYSFLSTCICDDIYSSVAKQCLISPGSVNMFGEAELVTRLINEYPIDGVLYGFFAFDRWIGGIHKTLVRVLEERTSIPHFYLEGDFWDESRYTIEDRIARIRGICNCLKISSITN